MKKILFVCYGLGIGGIEKCFVNLLNVMPENYDIDVLLMNPQYAFKNQIKRNVRFLDTFDYVLNIEDTVGEIKQRGGIFRNLRMLLSYCVFRLRIKLHKDAWVGFRPLPEEYDIAVAYSHHDYSPYYVIDKVRAKKKVMWYHNGAYEQEGRYYERDKRYYPEFDHIVAVSSDCAKVLSEKFSFREGQLLVLKNLCDADGIKSKAAQDTPASFEMDGFHLVTVGRMTSEKGASLALEACKRLCDQGRNVRWHWVGDGNQFIAIQSEIAELGLENRFILEGNQDNPYPYIRYADAYVQPSYYEAYSTTITEAKVLGRPIVTTDVGGMRDQLTNGVNGLIVPIEADAIADAVEMLMDHEEMRNSFSATLKDENFSSEYTMQEYQKTVFF
jgi:glycosyltransferase involved in cell wall biosynthesis